MIKINLEGKDIRISQPTILKDLIKDNSHKYICARVNGYLKELNYLITTNSKIKLFTIKDLDAINVYTRSLNYLICMAFYNLYPKIKLKITYSISRCFYAEDINGNVITKEMINKVQNEMEKIINHDYIFERIKVKNKIAKAFYKKLGFNDKLELLQYRPEKSTHFYKVNNYYNYFYGYMVYSTGYIKSYKLILDKPGFFIQYPRAENYGTIPKFENAPIYKKALNDSAIWAKEMECENIIQINKKTLTKKRSIDFINECEARHSRMLCELGDKIEKNIKKLKLICIAGPSSSGKTTFANRLRIELLSRGIHPIMISLDNYYKPINEIPKDSKGDYDFECLEALKLPLLNKHLEDVVKGKEIKVPIYNFSNPSTNKFTKVKISDNKQIVIIEGIHALNEKLTYKVKKENKFKIYISPQIQINIDNENPLSLTDFRLLRRITRDNKFRNIPPLRTIKMWPSVRNGEFRWIYQGIENADYVFNSFLYYELNILKNKILPQLEKIDKNEPLYEINERLIRMLKFIRGLSDEYIPCNSLIKEFIGGSCFE